MDAPLAGNVVGFFHEYGPNGWFSNWYPAVFTVDGVTYLNAEQYLMHYKALCCGDEATAARVMENPDPKTVKLLGRAITPYDDAKWEQRLEAPASCHGRCPYCRMLAQRQDLGHRHCAG